MSPKELRSRWTDADAERARETLLAVTRKDHFTPIPDGAFDWRPRHEGRVDLRGLYVDRFILFKRLEALAFDYGEGLGGWDIWAEVVGCSFDGVPINLLQGRFERCSFHRANLSRGSLVGEFIDCDFSRANLSHVKSGATFRRCRFDGANLRQAHIGGIFESCSFDGARFGFGSLYRSEFIDTSLDGVDLKDTIMDKVTFR